MFTWPPPLRLRCLVVVCLSLLTVNGGSAPADEKLYFESEIRPILREYCFDCHGATEEMEGGLDLRLVHFIRSGGDSGAALVPGDPDASLLLSRIIDGDMPPGEARVSDDKIAVLEKWIRQGAATLREEPEQLGPGIPITEEERNYWAYQPITQPKVSLDSNLARVRTPIDALIAAAMPAGLTFSPDAERFTIIQRVFYDLIGLPPSKDQIEYWLHHADVDWYEQLLDHLLRSPHYGERWARHWLDAAGYADSDGYTLGDISREWAWRYRDYVIRAFNDDKPFDQFITEQLAGDEIAGPATGDWTERQIELLTATGFLRMAADGTGSGDNSPEARNKTIADTLQIVSTTLLGASVQCAQCHDHRYDPISHADYFSLRAVFEPALDWQAWKTPAQRLVSLYTEQDRAVAAAIESQVKQVAEERAAKQAEFIKEVFEEELLKFEEPLRSQLRSAYETTNAERSPEQKALLASHPSINISAGVLYQYRPKAAEELKGYDAKMAEMRAQKPVEQFIHALVEPANHVPVTRLFHRGDYKQPMQEIQPAALTVTAPEGSCVEFPVNDPNLPTTGRRLAFSRWLVDRGNPLTARAIVNRIWMHHFGRGIVSTPGEFGRLGDIPSNVELLDELASDFMEHGWSLKHLHRRILTSTVWRQSSLRDPAREALDADNHFYSRKSIQRMDAEILRDSILQISGDLDREPFGPPVAIAEDETGQVRVDAKQPRRSIYVQIRRSQPVGMLQTFDAPVMSVNCDVRPVSTSAPQSLMMLNGEFILDQAARVAERAIAAVRAKPASDSDTADGTRASSASEAASASWSPDLPSPTWKYGTGTIDEEAGMLREFVALPHFTGTHWQGGPKLPAATLGWVSLHARGGHPGDPKYPAIRRWSAPSDGHFSVAGTLQHHSSNGDGVRGRIFSADRLLGSWNSLHNSVVTEVESVAVKAGESIDLVTDCIARETSDGFAWEVKITFTPAVGEPVVFDSAAEFQGPTDDYTLLPAQIAAAWEIILSRSPSDDELHTALEFAEAQLVLMARERGGVMQGRSPSHQVLVNLCQMLISSNEFVYIE